MRPRSARGRARNGLTRGQTLWRIELPLAVPAMVAGLRVAVVSTIALATVAALVVPQGLGYPIFLALRDAFKTEIIVAGGLAVGIALVADGLLVVAQRALTPWTPRGGRRDPRRSRRLPRRSRVRLRRAMADPGQDVGAPAAVRGGDGLGLLVALPLGVWLGHLHRGSFVAINSQTSAERCRAWPSLPSASPSSASASPTSPLRSSSSRFRRSLRTRTLPSTGSSRTRSRPPAEWG